MTEQVKTVTQDDLHRLEAEGKRVEVHEGSIVEAEPVTNFHLIIIRTLFRILDAHVIANALGDVYMDGFRYVLFGNQNDIQTDYIPDLSFLRMGRIPADYDYNDDFPGAPDLAVEIASPGQGPRYMLSRAGKYFEAGTEEVWLIYPNRREIHQFRYDKEEVQVYRGEDVVDTSVLFPGLSLMAGTIFEVK